MKKIYIFPNAITVLLVPKEQLAREITWDILIGNEYTGSPEVGAEIQSGDIQIKI